MEEEKRSKMDGFKDLKLKVEEDLKLTENNVMSKSLDIPVIYHRYLDIYIRQMKVLKKLKVEKEQMYQKLYHHHKFEGQYQLSTKNEIDCYVHGDDEYVKFCIKYNQQELIVEYLENVLKMVQQMTFTIKNFVEYKKFLVGE